MRITMRLLIAATIVLMILVPSAYAQQNGQEGNVMMANRLLLTIRCPSSGYSVAERANAIQLRLNDLIVPGGVDLNSIKIKTVRNTTAIYVAGKLLVTVTPCDAKANRTTPTKLAKRWVVRFKQLYPMIIPPHHGQSPRG